MNTASNGGTPRIRFSSTTIAIGCTTTPVNRSVFVKQARSMLGLFCNWRPYLFVRNVCTSVTSQSLSTYGSYKMKTKLTILHHLIPLRNKLSFEHSQFISTLSFCSQSWGRWGGGEINSIPSLIRRSIILRHANPDVTRFFILSPWHQVILALRH